MKVEFKLSLCLIKQYAMKTYRGAEALYGGEWSASRLDRFIPGGGGKEHPVPFEQKARWALKPVWTMCRKISLPLARIEPRLSGPSIYRLSYPGYYSADITAL
jgi:hypothetical protein